MPNWMKMILREAEGVSGGAAAPAPAPADDNGTVLFPADAPAAAPDETAPAADRKSVV